MKIFEVVVIDMVVHKMSTKMSSGVESNVNFDMSNVVLATASYDHTIRFWHPVTTSCIHTLQHVESQVNALEVTPDGSMLAAAGYQHIRMYDLSAGNPSPIINYEGVSKNVTAVGFQSDARWMFTGGEDCSARVWDLRSRQLQCQRIFQVNTPVHSVCLHPNQVELFVADASGILYLWDLRNDHNDQISLEPTQNSVISIQDVAVDPEGTSIAAVTNKGTGYVWSLAGSGPSAPPTNVDATNTIKKNTVLIPKVKLQVHEKYALKCKFSPDSTLLATTSADQTCRLWRTADFSEQNKLTSPKDKEPMKWVWDCAFTNDSQNIFVCSSDGMMRLFSVNDNEVLRQYTGHQKAITAMAFRDVNVV